MTKYIDLTHELKHNIPVWDLSCGFHNKIVLDYNQCDGPAKFRVQAINCPAGIGTHMDAPAHCFPGAKTIDHFSLEQCRKSCVVINIADKAQADNGYQLTIEDINLFEEKHGDIALDSFVIVYTGWSKYWNNPEKYHNNLIFPSVSAEAAEYLLAKNIAGLGIDTLSPDIGESNFDVHRILLGANKFIIENIAQADLMPAVGADVLILPLKIKDGTEAPLRLVGVF